MALVVEGGLSTHLGRRWFNRMLHDIENHFIICGNGPHRRDHRRGVPQAGCAVVVIDRRPERRAGSARARRARRRADASREDVLTRVGIHRARGLIAAVGTDAENVYTVLTHACSRPDLFIIAARWNPRTRGRSSRPRGRGSASISPYQLGGIQMAATASRPAVVDFMRLATTSERLDLSAEQWRSARTRRSSSRTLREAKFPAGVRA
jgi:voltage-gated potassium channel